MEWYSLRRNENDCDAIGMLDLPRDERQRQLRRLRQERVGGEKDRGADRAVVVGVVVAWLSRGTRLRTRRGRAGDGYRRRSGTKAVDMDVPERHDHLQRQRGERQPTAKSGVATNPAHEWDPITTRPQPCTFSLSRQQFHNNASGLK